jgi:hypothetical protein
MILHYLKPRLKRILTGLAIYISVTGLVTFSLFILEESIQTAMFGTWPAQDARDWRVVQFGIQRIREANVMLKTVNYCFGWIQPLAFIAYRAYGRSTDAYIAGMEAKLFAYAPELFDGKEVIVTFTPEALQDGLYVNHRLRVAAFSPLSIGRSKEVRGLVSLNGDWVLITESKP